MFTVKDASVVVSRVGTTVTAHDTATISGKISY
jgi:hypothetical protein